MNHAVMPTYGRTDVQFVRGEGAWLIDEQGERYLEPCLDWVLLH